MVPSSSTHQSLAGWASRNSTSPWPKFHHLAGGQQVAYVSVHQPVDRARERKSSTSTRSSVVTRSLGVGPSVVAVSAARGFMIENPPDDLTARNGPPSSFLGLRSVGQRRPVECIGRP